MKKRQKPRTWLPDKLALPFFVLTIFPAELQVRRTNKKWMQGCSENEGLVKTAGKSGKHNERLPFSQVTERIQKTKANSRHLAQIAEWICLPPPPKRTPLFHATPALLKGQGKSGKTALCWHRCN